MEILSRYTIIETIFETDIYIINRCIDNLDSSRVIVKSIKKDISSVYFDTLKNEFRILKSFYNSNLCLIKPLDIEENGDSVIMILENFDGLMLSDILERELLKTESFFDIALQLADILSYLHENNVILQSLTPNNIMYNTSSKKISLFNIDNAFFYDKNHPAAINLPGSNTVLQYLSPEQTGRFHGVIDYRSNLYSLGILFYHLVTKKAPFEITDSVELVHSIITEIPKPPVDIIKNTISHLSGVLSAIIMKLIEKEPEKRYNSAKGLKYDIEQAIQIYHNNRSSDSFYVGERDAPKYLTIRQKLYSRESEAALITNRAKLVLNGNKEVLIIKGDTGIGKSFLVEESLSNLDLEDIIVLKGVYLQNNAAPYFGIIQAVNEWINKVTTKYHHRLNEWKKKLLETLGDNAGIISQIIPELKKIIGTTRDIVELNANEGKTRFLDTFYNFFNLICCKESPIILFLDNLHWSDSSSLELINSIFSRNINYLLFISTYRENENSQSIFLNDVFKIMQERNKITLLHLQPLSKLGVKDILLDIFNETSAEMEPLVEEIYKKTKGNPLFIHELLKELYSNNIIRYNTKFSKWMWNISNLANFSIKENIVDYIISRLNNTDSDTLRILKICACVGNNIPFSILQNISAIPEQKLSELLKNAVDNEFLSPFYNLDNITGKNRYSLSYSNLSFNFYHDKIFEVIHKMLSDNEKASIHASIFTLLNSLYPTPSNEQILKIAYHLNAGSAKLPDIKPNDLVVFFLKAGKIAAASYSYNISCDFFLIAKKHMQETDFNLQHELFLELYQNIAESSYMLRLIEEGDDAIETILKNSISELDYSEALEIKGRYYMFLGQMPDSISYTLQGLSNLGVKINKNTNMIDLLYELIRLNISTIGLDTEALLNNPELADEKKRLIIKLLANLIPPAFISGKQSLFGVAVMKMARHSIKYGNTPESGAAYVGYAVLLSALGDFKKSYQYGKLALKLNRKFNDIKYYSMVQVLFTLFCRSWNEPWKNLQTYYGDAIRSSLKSGELLYLAHAAFYQNLWHPSIDLETLLSEFNSQIIIIEKSKYRESLYTAQLARQKILSLMGILKNINSFDSEQFSEKNYLETLTSANYFSGIGIFYSYKIQIAFYFEDYDNGLNYIDESEKFITSLKGSAFMEELSLFTALTITQTLNKMSLFKRLKYYRKLTKIYNFLNKIAEISPDNFLFHKYLIQAELFRLKVNYIKASFCYDKAIESAENAGFVRYKALSNEIAAKFYLSINNKKTASFYFREAYSSYSSWNAKGKLQQLRSTYRELILSENYHKGNNDTLHLDLLSIVKSAQIFSSQMDYSELLKAAMKLLIENAGAQYGLLIITDENTPYIEVMSQGKEITILEPIKVYDFEKISGYAFNEAYKGKTIISPSAVLDDRFAKDKYIHDNDVKSLLAISVNNKTDLTVLLYLENNLVKGAFTTERVEVLNLLLTEFIISIENSKLYKKLKEVNENLELKVSERTTELEQAKLNLELQKSAAETARAIAENATLAKSEFLATMTHELRTPMNSVIGLTSLLAATSITKEQQDLLAKIEFSAQHLLSVVNDVLDFSKFESGNMILESIDFSLENIFENVKGILENLAQKKGLTLITSIDKDVPLFIKGDPLRLQQVLLNLAGNGIKFTEEGNITIKASLISKDEEKTLLKFSITDTGIGITDRQREYLFNFFSQADISIAREYGGTGLGLAISRKIVENTGGKIDFLSEPQKGSCFFFTMPFAWSEKTMVLPKNSSVENKTLKGNKSKPHILIVDDNIINTEVTSEILKKFEVTSDIAHSGMEAVLKVTSNKYDLIFMDIQMPEMDGFQTTHEIRKMEKYSKLPIIAMTAFAQQEAKTKCLASGMNDFVTKPITPANITSIIEKWYNIEVDTTSDNITITEDRVLFGIDYPLGIKNFVNDEVLYNNTLRKFCEIYKKAPEEIDFLIKNNKKEELGMYLHKMKGIAGTLGATKLFSIIKKFEKILSGNNSDELDLCYKEFVFSIREVLKNKV